MLGEQLPISRVLLAFGQDGRSASSGSVAPALIWDYNPRTNRLEAVMKEFIIRVVATKTFMGNDDPLIWHFSVPASSSKAAIQLMWESHPYAAEITSVHERPLSILGF